MNFIRRMGSGDKEPEVVGTYLVLTVILHLSGLTNPPWVAIGGYEWIVLLLIGLAAVLVRRRFLLASTLIVLLCGAGLLAVGSIGGYFLLFECVFGLFLLGSSRLRTAAFALLCLAAIVLGIAAWLGSGDPQQVVLSLFMAGFILFTPMLWAQNVRTAKDLATAEAPRVQAVQSAAAAREDQLVAEHEFSRVEERTALAREMHDVLSARFSSIALLSGALLPSAPETVRAPLQSIRDESVSGLEDMAEMVRMLHSGGAGAAGADRGPARAGGRVRQPGALGVPGGGSAALLPGGAHRRAPHGRRAAGQPCQACPGHRSEAERHPGAEPVHHRTQPAGAGCRLVPGCRDRAGEHQDPRCRAGRARRGAQRRGFRGARRIP